jgi:hypothetical protein
MPDVKRILKKIQSAANAELLVGCCFLLSGVILVWTGAAKIQLLYQQFSGYFPIALPDNTAKVLLRSFPLILKTFITTVGAICAVIMGVLWAMAGAAEAFEGRKQWAHVPDLDQPEVVAESLRLSQSLYWKFSSVFVRILGRLLLRARFISPISYELFRKALVSSLKIVILWLVIAVALQGLSMLPALVQKYFQVKFTLTVPSPGPLYSVLFFLVVANGVIAVSLLPFRKPQYVRTREAVPVQGTGDPHLFFALLEEGCRLLSADGSSRNSPTRLQLADNSRIIGTLVESHPKGTPSLARPAGYLCLPLVPILLSLGFSRLIHFSPAIDPVYFTEFLSSHFPAYILEVALGLAFILSGVYFGDWARRLLGIHRFQSALVFCHLVPETGTSSTSGGSAGLTELGESTFREWTVVEELDERFARWARNPNMAGSFVAEVCWAEILSESASAEGPRFVTGMQESGILHESMQRLSQLPFHVNFSSGAPAGTPSLARETRSRQENPRPESDTPNNRV